MDLISRKAAIDALGERPIVWDEWADEYSLGQRNQYDADKSAIETLPSKQPERLTDDDFETIRIHLNAYKEKLFNQNRRKEAEEYQRIIDRFMSFASAQPEYFDYTDIDEAWEYYAKEQDANLTDNAKQIKDAMWVGYRIGLKSAQPEIIRCKDCKYNSCSPQAGNACCDIFYGMTDQMGYCHYAERRTDDSISD